MFRPAPLILSAVLLAFAADAIAANIATIEPTETCSTIGTPRSWSLAWSHPNAATEGPADVFGIGYGPQNEVIGAMGSRFGEPATVARFDSSGSVTPLFTTADSFKPIRIAGTREGHLVIAGASNDLFAPHATEVRRYTTDGLLLAAYPLPQFTAPFSDHDALTRGFDLAADGCLVYYTRRQSSIGRFDSCTGTELPDLISFGSNAVVTGLAVRPDAHVQASYSILHAAPAGAEPRNVVVATDGTAIASLPVDVYGGFAFSASGQTQWFTFGTYAREVDLYSRAVIAQQPVAHCTVDPVVEGGWHASTATITNIPMLNGSMTLLLAVTLIALGLMCIRR